MPDERRAATLLAFIRALEASAQDDVLDLLDVIVNRPGRRLNVSCSKTTAFEKLTPSVTGFPG
jgi:hypothetical protein